MYVCTSIDELWDYNINFKVLGNFLLKGGMGAPFPVLPRLNHNIVENLTKRSEVVASRSPLLDNCVCMCVCVCVVLGGRTKLETGWQCTPLSMFW